jgi:hypothetical protein
MSQRTGSTTANFLAPISLSLDLTSQIDTLVIKITDLTEKKLQIIMLFFPSQRKKTQHQGQIGLLINIPSIQACITIGARQPLVFAPVATCISQTTMTNLYT